MADDLAWETLDSGIDYACPGFAVRRDEVRLPDGSVDAYHSVEEEDSVVVVPFTPDDEVVVIEEWRQAVGRVSYGFPAGGRDPGDADLAATAHRELTEETGYVADEVDHLLSVEPMNGLVDTELHFFVATDCMETGQQVLDDNESIEVDLTSWSHLHDLIEAGELQDGRTVLGVLYYDLVRQGS